MYTLPYDVQRREIEKFYGDKATIKNTIKRVNTDTGATEYDWEIVAVDVPCRLGWGGASTSETETVTELKQQIKVMINPEVVILEGSRLHIVTESGRAFDFEASTPTEIVPSHQIVALSLLKRVT